MIKKAQLIVKTCPRRDLELERVKNFLSANGFDTVEKVESRQWRLMKAEQFDTDADFVLLSTCAFSAVTEEAAIHDLRLMQRAMKPSTTLAVCGCLPEINPDRLAEVFTGCAFGPRSYEALNGLIEARWRIEEFPKPNSVGRAIDGTFKIQIHEGCPCKCSYCAINKSIGSLRSRPAADIIAEFKTGLRAGHTSFAFLGDCSGAFGLDRCESLSLLLRGVIALEGRFTLSLTDIAPFHLAVCFEEVRTLCTMDRVTTLYVAIQSANQRILRLMRRTCDMQRVKKMLIEIGEASPALQMITSIIIGFPSETQEELDETLQFCQDVGFNQVYCHGYSTRPGVDSAALPGQHSAAEISRRLAHARACLGEQAACLTDPGAAPAEVWTRPLSVKFERIRAAAT
jgi:tRNA A37 methylthiotransferase MiaB